MYWYNFCLNTLTFNLLSMYIKAKTCMPKTLFFMMENVSLVVG